MSELATRPVRVLVADDQTLFRSGLVKLLDSDPRVEVVGEAEDGQQAVELANKLRPDVVLMDMKMPNLDGVEATRRITSECPGTRVLILSTFDVETYVLRAMRADASGYVLKDAQVETIVSSIIAVADGGRVMASTVVDRIMDMVGGVSNPKEFYDGLTAREIEVLKLMAAGMPNKQIAYRLRISEKTVRNHVSHMYEKLHIYDRSQATLYAVRKGLVEL